ncbi:MAG: hypothetical protein VXY93_14595, partial [Pseudomonadota bacterium]|nr:hypothetical protein [Pseudomonadota bacterium]
MTNTGGSLYIRSTSSIQLETNGGVDMLTLGVGGAATLFHNGSAKLATTSTGVDVTGNISLSNLTISGTEIDLSSGDLTLDVAGNIILDADGAVVKIQDGGVDLAQLSSGSQNLNIRSLVADKDIRLQGYDGDLSTLVTGLTIDFSDGGRALFGSSVALLSDTTQLQLGAGNDFQIGYDGTDAYLRNHSGGNIIQRARTGFIFQTNATGGGADDAIRAAQNGAVTLYYDGSAKLATTSTGVQTTGTLNVNGAYSFPT